MLQYSHVLRDSTVELSLLMTNIITRLFDIFYLWFFAFSSSSLDVSLSSIRSHLLPTHT
jgi:hypothetical protein